MKSFTRSSLAIVLLFAMLLSACSSAATTEAPAPTQGAPTAQATDTQPAATTAATTEATTAATTEATTAATTAATTEATSAPSTGAALTLPAECTNVTLAYWTPFTGPDGPFMNQLVQNFNTANPNIKVTETDMADYVTQYGTAAASDTLPDVAIVNEDQVATQVFRNVLRPMDDVIAQTGLKKDDFPAVAWGAGTIAGKQYAVPLSFVAMTMYYNADLFKAAGIANPPKTAADFAAAAAAITKGDNNGFIITTGFPVQQIFQMLLHQYGGTEFNADGTKATWNSPAGVKALQWMVDAQKKYSKPNLEVDADLNAFKAGTVGMIWNGSWQIPNVTGSGVEFDGQPTAPPQIGDQPAVWAGGPLLTLPVHKKGYDKCKDTASAMLIKYLEDNAAEWAKAGNIPASKTARNSDAFKALPQSALAPALDNPIFPPAIPGISDAFGPLGEAIGAIMAGTNTDIQKALDDSANRADQILAQNKSTYGDAPKGQ
jgi:multiple sugar transport system substrate-binding protein